MTDKEVVENVLLLCTAASAALNNLVDHIEKGNLNQIFLANDEIDFGDENMIELSQCISMMYDTEKSCVRILTEKIKSKIKWDADAGTYTFD